LREIGSSIELDLTTTFIGIGQSIAVDRHHWV
jgi:hypothetical protein